ncbi:MAG: hypothetical protein M3X11_18520 [Acidobacteriota bacterium]|nr:hypothetical protein [Acidobacteriota bacterium]
MNKNHRRKATLVTTASLSSLFSLILVLALTPSGYAQTVRQAAGSTPADI